MEKQDQFVDELLDAGLARYGNVTPRPGLEGRILANVHAEQGGRAWFAWAGGLASGAVAAAVILGVLELPHLRIPPPPPVPFVQRGAATNVLAPVVSPAQPTHVPHGTLTPAHPVAGVTARTLAPEPHLAQFPSPQPLTDQERLLIEYVRHTPAEILSARATESTVIPELEIKELEITPLETEQAESQPN
ncbi:MAG: hypothetical protein ABSB82_23425 [Terriglobia bacterium]|jgi:hypothetical protein